MALSASTLSSQLQAFAGQGTFPANYTQAGQKWADAYATYAADAMSPMGGSPTTISAAQPTLASALASVFASAGGDASATATGIANALAAFWFAPPIVFSGGPPGTVTAALGGPALASALLSVFSSNISGQLAKGPACDAIAAAIDAFTKTVVVTHPVVPTPIVGPIT